MNFTLGAVFTVLSLIYSCYMLFLGFTSPDSITYNNIFIFIALLSACGYFLIMGAYSDAKALKK